MAFENFQVVVTEKGTKIVRTKLESIGKAGKQAQGGVKLLNTALGTLALTAVVGGLVRMVDTYTNLQNRMKLVTKGTKDLNNVTEQLFQISKDTRTSYESSATLFSRVSLAVDGLGVSQQRVLGFTKSLNQAVILSGASAIESNAAIIQLSQGLASGALRGDEFRSVMEQLPLVGKTIQESLGITQDQLRAMAKAGEISSLVIIQAFEKANETLTQQFAQTVPTISQSFTVLSSEVMRFVGQLNEASGIGATFSNALLFLANNVGVLATALGALTVIIGVNLAVAAGRAAVSAFNSLRDGMKASADAAKKLIPLLMRLNVVLLANPWILIATAVAAVVAALVIFRDEISEVGGAIGWVGDRIKEVVDWIWELVKAVGDAAQKILYHLGLIGEVTGSNGTSKIEVKLNGDDAAAKIAKAMDGNEAAKKIRDAKNKDRDAELKEMGEASEKNAKKIEKAHTAGGKSVSKAVSKGHREGGQAAAASFEAAGLKINAGSARMIDAAGKAAGTFQTAASIMLKTAIANLVLIREQAKAIGDATALKAEAQNAAAIQARLDGGHRGSGRSVTAMATGGSFAVGGVGGVDTNVMSINNEPVARVTRGEKVTVTPEGQAGGGRPVNVIMNIETKDAESFQRSQPQILARANATMTRAATRNN